MTSAEKLFSILETLCIRGDMSAYELSQELDVSKGSVHRILNTLRELGYVEAGSGVGRYVPTLKIAGLGRQVEAKSSLVELARPYMRELLAKYGVVVNLGVFSGQQVNVVERFNPTGTPVSIVMDFIVPAYCSALGKLFLSTMTAAEVESYMEQVRPVAFTEHTITDTKDLLVELEQVRRNGYAVDNRELNLNLSCLAMPIVGRNGGLLAAISLAGLAATSGPVFEQQQEDLRSAAQGLSEKLPL